MVTVQRQLKGFIAFAFACILLSGAAFACNPVVPSVCEAYSRAEAVFVGELIKVEKATTSRLQVDAHFKVEKIFKGKTNGVEIVRFDGGDCGPVLALGERHIVYKEEPSYRIANRTRAVRPESVDLKYAESLSHEKPVFLISGRIDGLNGKDLGETKMYIKEPDQVVPVVVYADGTFTATVQKNGEYHVRIELPFRGLIQTEILGDTSAVIATDLFEYRLNFRANDCDHRIIRVSHYIDGDPVDDFGKVSTNALRARLDNAMLAAHTYGPESLLVIEMYFASKESNNSRKSLIRTILKHLELRKFDPERVLFYIQPGGDIHKKVLWVGQRKSLWHFDIRTALTATEMRSKLNVIFKK